MYALIVLSLLSQTGGLTVVPSAPADSTPFAVKIEIAGLESNTAYDCGVWVYGKPASISQVWTEDGWKGGYRYVSLTSDNNGQYISYKKLRIVKLPNPAYDYYIKCTIKDFTGNKLIEHKIKHSEGFNLIDIEEGGCIEGIIYRDSSLFTPLENTILFVRDSDGNVIGGYLSEDNLVEEGYGNTPGYFRIGLPSTTITSILVEDNSGNPLGQIIGEWEVPAGSAIDIGDVFSSNIVIPAGGIRVSPPSVFPGESVEITATVQNTGQQTLYSIPVRFSMRERKQVVNGDSIIVVVDSIPGISSVDVSTVWSPSGDGNYLIKGEVGLAAGFARLRVGDPLDEIVVNEIMCYPDLLGDWLEVTNRTDTPVDIKEWKLESSNDIVFITRETCIIEGKGFAVVCDSKENEFRALYGYIPPEVPIISLSGKLPDFRGTSKDTIRIIDADGFVIDEVRYDKDWIPDKGVSMERISPDIASNIKSNWGRCVESQYRATPGRQNSIFANYTPKNLEFTCSDVFCPTSDDKMCFVEYRLPFQKAHIRLYVYDRVGRPVKKILDGNPTGSASYSVDDGGNIVWTHIWNGRGDDGNMLPMGVYIVFLEAQSEETNEIVRGKRTITLIKDMR
ncbi:MAG: lamin tail domain-containing protein [candidate division WOR-3 bacterium]|nr:lamin tail domain-containing protein [candidate division WOR-3 bacterium]